MDVDSRYEVRPSGQRHEIEAANTLASIASFNIRSPTLPLPTQSFSSVNSHYSSPEPRSPGLTWIGTGSTQFSFGKDSRSSSQFTLPRLRELDLKLRKPENPPRPPSAGFLGPCAWPRRPSIEPLTSFPDSCLDCISSSTAYRMPLPDMADPEALPSPSLSDRYLYIKQHLQGLPVTVCIGSSPSRRPRRSPAGSRCNVKYTIQQVDFIDYFRVDHHLSWKEVEAKYASTFPEDAAKGHKRGPQGLQGVYYRKNKQIPATDQNNLLIFDEDDNPQTFQRDVREQSKTMNSSIGLLAMHPERAITYSWVSEEHKRQYDKIGLARQAQLDAAEQRKKRRRAIQDSCL